MLQILGAAGQAIGADFLPVGVEDAKSPRGGGCKDRPPIIGKSIHQVSGQRFEMWRFLNIIEANDPGPVLMPYPLQNGVDVRGGSGLKSEAMQGALRRVVACKLCPKRRATSVRRLLPTGRKCRRFAVAARRTQQADARGQFNRAKCRFRQSRKQSWSPFPFVIHDRSILHVRVVPYCYCARKTRAKLMFRT